jgi:hypothetical protein
VVLKVGFPKGGVFNIFLTMEFVIDRFYLIPKPHQSGSLSHGFSPKPHLSYEHVIEASKY